MARFHGFPVAFFQWLCGWPTCRVPFSLGDGCLHSTMHTATRVSLRLDCRRGLMRRNWCERQEWYSLWEEPALATEMQRRKIVRIEDIAGGLTPDRAMVDTWCERRLARSNHTGRYKCGGALGGSGLPGASHRGPCRPYLLRIHIKIGDDPLHQREDAAVKSPWVICDI